MESNNFTCICTLTIPLEDEESIFSHISGCETYQRISPNSQIFESIALEKLDIGQLLALKTEYNIYLRGLDEELKKSGLYTKFY